MRSVSTPGGTSPRKRGRGRLLVGTALGLVALASCLGPTAGQVDLARLGAPVEKPLRFPAGKRLAFAVHLDDYSYSGANKVLLDVTLLRSGSPVGSMSCQGFRVKGGAGCGGSATSLNSDCAMTVPAGGSDAVRVVARLAQPGNKLDFKGLSVYLRD